MDSSSRTRGAVLLLQALFLAADAFGAPVLADETSPAPASLESAGELSRSDPATAAPQHGAATTPTDGSQFVAMPARRQGPAIAPNSAPTRALPPGEGHEAAPASAPATFAAQRPQTGAISTAPGLSFDDAIDPDLKEAAKTALQWTREVREWLQPARPEAADSAFQASGSVDGSAPTGGATGSEGRVQSNPGSRMEYQPASWQVHPSGPRSGAEVNLIQEGIKLVKDIAWHPITWLLMSLVAIGSLAVLITQYRDHVARRRFRVHATRGQRGSSDRGERRRERKSRGAAGISSPVRRAAEKPARPRVRRSAKPQVLD